MLNFTKQERLVLVFLGFSALVGLIANHCLKKSATSDNFYSMTIPTEPEVKIDINKATREQLDMLPGIGPVLSQRIIDYRQQNGPFKNPEDLRAVKGISPKLFQKIKGQLFISL